MAIRNKKDYQKHQAQHPQLSMRKYYPNNQQNAIITPQIIPHFSSKPTSQIMHPQYIPSRRGTLMEKQQNIRTIDEKINTILQKHKTKDLTECSSHCLDLKNQYERQYIKNVHRQTKKQAYSLKLIVQNVNKGVSINNSPLRSNRVKQECQKLRQRSINIFRGQPYPDNYDNKHFLCDKDEINPKYDSQIEKLNRRIKKAQQCKKKLNIEFKPYEVFSKSKSIKKCTPQYRSISALKDQCSFRGLPNEQIKEQKRINEFNISCEIKPSKKCGAIMKNKAHQKDNKQYFTSRNAHQDQLDMDNFKYSNSFLPLKSDCQSNTTKGQQTDLQSDKIFEEQDRELKIFRMALQRQIELDHTLRNFKIWLTFSRMPNKWSVLQEAIRQKRLSILTQDIREIFQSTMQEHNIFFRWENVSDQTGIQLLLNAYQQSEAHWNNNLDKMLTVQFFSSLKDKKIKIFNLKSVVLQDVLMFMNDKKDKFYLNRDISLIYMRLLDKSKTINTSPPNHQRHK